MYIKNFLFHRLQVFLIEYTYTANTLRTINALYGKFSDEKSTLIRKPTIGYSYFFKDHEAIDGTLYFTKKLLSEASGLKRRIIVIVPEVACVNSICRSKDLEMIYNGKDYKNLKWYLDFKKIAAETKEVPANILGVNKDEFLLIGPKEMMLITSDVLKKYSPFYKVNISLDNAYKFGRYAEEGAFLVVGSSVYLPVSILNL